MKKLLLASLLALGMTGAAMAEDVTLKYTGTTTTNMTGGNDAALLGVSAEAWSVVGDKGSNSNLPGLNKAGDIRLYYHADGSNVITVTSLTGANIATVSFTYTGDGYNNASVLVNNAPAVGSNSGTTGSYTINASEFQITNGNTSNVQVRIQEIVMTLGESSGETPVVTTAPTISGEASANGYLITLSGDEGNSIYYTLDGSTPNDASTLYSAPFEITETTTVKAIAYDDNDIASSVTTKKFTIEKDYNTAETALTVAEANAYIAANQHLDWSVFTKGTVCNIQELSTKYGNATYSITTDNDTLLVYRGYGLEGVKFADSLDLLVGDEVIVYGKLVNFNGTYEYTTGSKIVSQVKVDRPTVDPDPEPEPYVFVGDGTFANAYTVDDVLAVYSDTATVSGVWVKGIVKGAADGALNKIQTDSVTVVSNIVLTDEEGHVIPVALAAKSDHRAALNLKDNASLIGTTVWVKGDILKYFNQAGVKNVTDWSFDGQTTGIRKVTEKALDNEPKVIFDILGKRVTTMKRPGVYIVNGKKVVLK